MKSAYGAETIKGHGTWVLKDGVVRFFELEGAIFVDRSELVIAKYGNKEILAKRDDIESYLSDPSYLWAEFIKK